MYVNLLILLALISLVPISFFILVRKEIKETEEHNKKALEYIELKLNRELKNPMCYILVKSSDKSLMTSLFKPYYFRALHFGSKNQYHLATSYEAAVEAIHKYKGAGYFNSGSTYIPWESITSIEIKQV